MASPATAAKEATERATPATVAEKRAAVRPVVMMGSENFSCSWVPTRVMALITGPLVSLTVSTKVSLSLAPAGSVAVTRRERLAASTSAGVPEKVRVAGLNVSQAGSGVPSALVAVRLRVSAGSGSVKVPAGRL